MRTCVSQPEDKREIISLRGIERLKLKFRGSTCSESSVASLRRRTNSHKCFSHVRSVQVRAIGVIWMSIDGRKLWRCTANPPLWYLPFPLFFLIQVEFRLIFGDFAALILQSSSNIWRKTDQNDSNFNIFTPSLFALNCAPRFASIITKGKSGKW